MRYAVPGGFHSLALGLLFGAVFDTMSAARGLQAPAIIGGTRAAGAVLNTNGG